MGADVQDVPNVGNLLLAFGFPKKGPRGLLVFGGRQHLVHDIFRPFQFHFNMNSFIAASHGLPKSAKKVADICGCLQRGVEFTFREVYLEATPKYIKG